MANFKAASRYAKGLYSFAKDENQAKELYAEMTDLSKSLKYNRELIVFLSSPVIESKKKIAIVNEIFSEFSVLTKEFIKLLITHHRGDIFPLVVDRYIDLYNQENNLKMAEITSAVKLDKASIEGILKKAKAILGEDTDFDYSNKVDESLIGGFILRIGDQQIDASVKNKLTQLKNQFSNDDYVAQF